MKTNKLAPVCAVQSITDHVGRRFLKFSRAALDTDLAQIPVKRRKPSFRLTMQVTPEAQFSFQPVIQVRSRAKS